MKFLKKTAGPTNTESTSKSVPDSNASQITEEKEPSLKGTGSFSEKSGRESKMGLISLTDVSLNEAPTLSFPSISTADFQFDLENASDIIVKKVIEFVNKLGNARLVLILSLVRAKASEKNIASNKFFTFVGDITRLHLEGGLHCNVIANAANWRLKPGGGGVNAAIFSARGPALEVPTKEQPSLREGLTHVIHVVGPNMNPHRPNCLNNDYSFATIVRTQAKSPKGSVENLEAKLPESQVHSDGSWAQALYNTAVHPEKHNDAVLEISDDVVVPNDLYPKHVLLVARCEGLDRLSDVRKEHLQLLRTMHKVCLKWVEKFLDDDSSLVFRLGYHTIRIDPTATPKPHTNPISTLIRSQSISCLELGTLPVNVGGGDNLALLSTVKEDPHNPLLPVKEALVNVEN
ncbi:transcription factor bHLH140 [Pyrus ussuriensis x Pyrus communis]|uniref:Transcription factor bHLH140 n=1 Tax=Pyrus ussuriensis x Pyrus communis TaxID=2448454 RepID=A0A5N5HRL8_9ROSA|nr:transcription factor bHLH140 [Pyrus ussuriensis x Pyrus communis]